MGSTKKRKDHKRNRSRSTSRDRSSRKRKHRDEERETKEKPELSETREKKVRFDEDDVEDGAATTSGGGGDLSMSIEETNKLRAQLGLAPLDLNDKPKVKEVKDSDGQSMEVVTVDGSEFVHKPAENWGKKKEAETIKEKLQALREKRALEEKLGKVKTLGAEDEEDSAASWVQKSRRIEDEKRMAELREKLLAEMDKDFGVSEVIAEEKKKPTGKKARDGYGSRDLAGMTVKHSKESLLQSQETILVLQDKDVLDEGEDVLVNPTISELDKWKQNAELRKKKPGYNPYDEELDEYGMPKRGMLSKYDEVIDGEKIDSFKLGKRGEADISAERERAEMLAKLHEGAESLELKPMQVANEYLTLEEMAKFKKPKRKVKVRKRVAGALKADDLLTSAPSTEEDFGSRDRGRGRKRVDYEVEGKIEVRREPGEIDDEEEANGDEQPEQPMNLDDDLDIVLSDDEAEQELQAALARTRQLQQMEAKKKVIPLLPKVEDDEEMPSERDFSGKIVLDSVSEYCRGLGDIPTYGMAGNRNDADDDGLIDVEQEASASTSRYAEEKDDDEEMDDRGGWYERDINDVDRPRSQESSDDELSREPILGEEPDMNNMGVAAALKLAVQKGYLKDETDDRGKGMELDHLKAKRFTIMDKQFHDIDDKYAKKLERMGGGGGPIVDFKEKRDYKPDVKLQYPDEKGRLMDPKDAFRHLSWKFHGKVPGKRKVEKRTKKLVEKELFNEMSSTDTPLGTLSKQIEKQRQMQTPFILLSGSSKDSGMAIKKE